MYPTKSSQRFDDLLQFFESKKAEVQQPIAHPDESVNRLSDKDRESFRRAAVLIPVTRINADSESHIVLTVRSANLKSHPGQISLPGGTAEKQDTDEAATALRESHEEIGLNPRHVEVLGPIGEMTMPSGYRVTPVVGLIERDLEFVPCPIEVAHIFQAPLDLVLDPDAYQHAYVKYENENRAVLELNYGKYRIWGATAAILYHLAREV